MANLFDSVNYPTSEPDILFLGDQWNWTRHDLATDYPVASYSLTYNARLLNEQGTTSFAITASEINSSYVISVSSSTTLSYTAGDYSWSAFITKTSDSNRISVDEGFFTVKKDKATDSGDYRSHSRIVLQALEDTIQNKANIDQMSMTIAGRSLSRMSAQEIRDWRSHYKSLVLAEEKRARIERGRASGSTIKVKF
jgi:hypothetical protein